MTRFRSKPVEIEAVQMTKQRAFDWDREVETLPNGVFTNDMSVDIVVYCRTRQGNVKADIGDWIIQESDGSGCYPCKPDVFAAKYEPVDEPPEAA